MDSNGDVGTIRTVKTLTAKIQSHSKPFSVDPVAEAEVNEAQHENESDDEDSKLRRSDADNKRLKTESKEQAQISTISTASWRDHNL